MIPTALSQGATGGCMYYNEEESQDRDLGQSSHRRDGENLPLKKDHSMIIAQ